MTRIRVRRVSISAEHSPKFELGERVLVFLKKTERVELNYPYGGYFIYRGNIGKRQVFNDKFSMPYTPFSRCCP